jgi:4-hydroxy-tetrahydrodipicolinate synthase
MFGYFKTLAERINFPMMVYNIPSTTKMSIPVEVVNELSNVKHICGFKDSERDEARMEQCVKLFKDREDFSYFLGYAAISAKALQIGADGLVPSTGNFAPGMFRAMWESAEAEQWQKVEQLQLETDEIAKIYQSGRTLGNSLQALKVMMSVQGLCQPYALPPLTDLGVAEQKEIINETEIIIKKYQLKK